MPDGDPRPRPREVAHHLCCHTSIGTWLGEKIAAKKSFSRWVNNRWVRSTNEFFNLEVL
jgi:hypothetical protein